MEPSPAAAVTRFTDPLRTSPAPKTPGWRVSRRKGGRPGCQFAPFATVRISLVRDESVAVQCQLIFELAGLGICANEEEQGARFPDAARSARAATGPSSSAPGSSQAPSPLLAATPPGTPPPSPAQAAGRARDARGERGRVRRVRCHGHG
jgi:hypothetical protein